MDFDRRGDPRRFLFVAHSIGGSYPFFTVVPERSSGPEIAAHIVRQAARATGASGCPRIIEGAELARGGMA